MDELYRDQILEHYKRPHNFGRLDSFDLEHEDTNPFCGDEQHVYIKLDADDRVSSVSFEGKGCAISTAATSMLVDELEGMSREELLRQPQQILAGLADQLVGEHGVGGGGDRAPLPLEGDLGDAAVLVEPDRHALLVAAERVVVLELEVGAIEPAEVVRPLVVLEDLIPVQLVHAARLAKRCNAFSPPCMERALQSISW